jgi:translation elongation factor EF-1beta
LPSVIEPSFGMGRILYALLEHSFSQDPQDEQRVVMSFNAAVAPCKCHVYPLQTNEKFGPLVAQVADLLMAAGLANKVDGSGQSIGRRYARADEVGTPYGVTVDFDTCNDGTVTLRDRDSQTQVRLPIAEVAATVKALVDGALSWEETVAKYSTGAAAEDEADEDEMDLGFDDDEDEDAPKAAAVVHAPGSRGAIAAEAKAKRDAETEVKKQEAMARLAKKEANQRSLCNLEIKPWEASQDLKALYAKIQATVVMEGLKWSENCALVDVAFGVQKIVCTAVIPLSLSMDAIIDEMTEETFVDEIQSMNMTSMSLL